MRTPEGRSAVSLPLPFRDKRRMRTSQDQTLPGMLSIVLFHSKVQSFNAPFKVITWFCTAHLLQRITRWPP